MKIVFVMENFDIGGVERVTLQLIKGLVSDSQFQVSILCQQLSGDMQQAFADVAQIQVFAKNFSTYNRLIKTLQPDVVVFTKGGLCRYGVTHKARYKRVVVQHVPIRLPETSLLKNSLRQVAATMLYRCVDKVVCVSDGILNDLISKHVVAAANAVRIYNPVLDAQMQTLAGQTQQQYQNYFVCVGRLHFQKGYDVLLQIARVVKARAQAFKVVIIGDGPDRELLSLQIQQMQLQDTVILHGAERNPYPFIQQANAILLSSRWEGLPTVLVEAASLHTPIIAFDCPFGPAELTNRGRTGILVAQGDVQAFAEHIVAVINGKHIPYPDVSEFQLTAAVSNYKQLFQQLSPGGQG